MLQTWSRLISSYSSYRRYFCYYKHTIRSPKASLSFNSNFSLCRSYLFSGLVHNYSFRSTMESFHSTKRFEPASNWGSSDFVPASCVIGISKGFVVCLLYLVEPSIWQVLLWFLKILSTLPEVTIACPNFTRSVQYFRASTNVQATQLIGSTYAIGRLEGSSLWITEASWTLPFWVASSKCTLRCLTYPS